jgi:hypothetical protein
MNSRHFGMGYGWIGMVLSFILGMQAELVTAADHTQDHSKASGRPVEMQQTNVARLIYKPPKRGAPAARVGAATRGPGLTGTRLYVLTPDHTGLTTQAQPALYWYVSKPAAARFEFALVRDDTLETVVETTLREVSEAGIQKIALKDHAVTLQPDIAYQWLVALIGSEEQRSRDIVASGLVQRVASAPGSGSGIAASEQQAIVYAEQGIWYDALATLSELIESRPADRQLRGMRAALLDQVGLQEVARFDRQAKP